MVQVAQLTVKDSANIDRDVATLTAIATLIGEVQASPTANSLLERVKALKTSIDASILPTGPGTATLAGRMSLASDDPAVATLGAVAGAKVVTDANGTLQQYLRGLVTFFANALGAGTAAAAHRTTLASDDPAVVQLNKFGTGKYVAVAASQSDAVIQASTGAAGDYLDHVIVVPATTAPGVVTIKDNTTALISYPGGATTALLTLTPFTIYVGAVSSSGAWKITTGVNVSVLAVGKFS